MTLADLLPGQFGTVREVLCVGLTRMRLLDLGLVPGTIVEAIMKSPLDDPIAYMVRGAVIALRKEDAKKVLIDGG
ncbi:MAG TPA: FeoA family protein [Fimbriimonadales bacterium]|jgi:ferrous iron transport protein A|nr:FeoA family protein [Fimbriimonadales bacterium]